MNGLFITFEGGEGSGKTTQISLFAQRLHEWLDDDTRIVPTREPGGTTGAESIRDLIVKGSPDKWDARTELYLINAARRDHVVKRIRPELDQGSIVLCDRFLDSTIVYQGYVKGLDVNEILHLHEQSTDNLYPAMTFLLDIAPEVGLYRASARVTSDNRFEQEGFDFHNKLRTNFLSLATMFPERIITIDASGTVDQVAGAIWQAFQTKLPKP
jgi:dTMP kinase